MDHEYPKFLTYATEAFLAHDVWDHLQIHQFFPKEFCKVPIPDYTNRKAYWSWYKKIILNRKKPKRSRRKKRYHILVELLNHR
jgi:hypothetical protein